MWRTAPMCDELRAAGHRCHGNLDGKFRPVRTQGRHLDTPAQQGSFARGEIARESTAVSLWGHDFTLGAQYK